MDGLFGVDSIDAGCGDEVSLSTNIIGFCDADMDIRFYTGT